MFYYSESITHFHKKLYCIGRTVRRTVLVGLSANRYAHNMHGAHNNTGSYNSNIKQYF